MKLIKLLKGTGCNIIIVLLRYFWYRVIYGKKIIAHQRVKIKGIKNITFAQGAIMMIGVHHVGLINKRERTVLDIAGTMIAHGLTIIKRGCDIGVAKDGILILKDGVRIASRTVISVRHWVEIGENTSIGWNCQILDDGWHELTYKDKKPKVCRIEIGKNNWIQSYCHIYKGVQLPEGIVLQSDSVLRSDKGIKPNSLVAVNNGFPVVIKEDVKWK